MRLSRTYLLFIALTTVMSACGEATYVDVSLKSGYREMVGLTYTVISPVSAYGIRKHSGTTVDYVAIMPPPGIKGSQVGFQIPIAIGHKLKVIGIYETNRIFDPSVSLRVELNEIGIPENLPIQVDLMRGNQGTTKFSLNPEVFQRD